MHVHGPVPASPRAKILCSAVAATLACLATGEVPAQDVRNLETVRVTARPLNDALQVNAGAFGAKGAMEVPLSIQSYDARTITDSAARTVRDVLANDPSVLSSSYGGGFDNFRLRGFAMDNFNTIRRDGMALAPHYDVPLELVERVDVLKGPSGFLYGFNSPGGTINYIPKRPMVDPFTSLRLTASSLQGRQVSVDTNQVAADGLVGYRVNAGYERVGNFDHLGDFERKFVGIATDLRLGDSVLLQANADWSFKSTMSDPLLRADQSGRSNPLDPSSFVLPPRVDRRDALSPSWYRHDTEAGNLEVKLEYALADRWTWVSQANYSRVERHGGYMDLFDIQPDGDIGFADLYQSRGEVFSTWAVQSYLSGTFTTGSVLHDVFAGASTRQFRDRSPHWDLVESRAPVSVSDISVGNIRNPVQPPRWDFGPEQAIDFTSSIRERSVFASDLMTFNASFQALLGGRYVWYKARNLSATALPQDKNVFVPTGALIYRPREEVMTYASYSRGFEKGDYAPYNARNANQPTDAIQSEQVEIGLKAELGAVWTLGVAAFDIKRDASYLDTDNTYVSNGRFHHRGVELNTSAVLGRRWTLVGNAAYLDTELVDVTDAATRGRRTEGVPRWKSALTARYRLRAVPGLSFDGTWSYVGSRAVDAQNSGFVPGYATWDAGASFQTHVSGAPALFRLYAKNLTNQYYYPGVYYSGGLELGRAREVHLSAQFDFR